MGLEKRAEKFEGYPASKHTLPANKERHKASKLHLLGRRFGMRSMPRTIQVCVCSPASASEHSSELGLSQRVALLAKSLALSPFVYASTLSKPFSSVETDFRSLSHRNWVLVFRMGANGVFKYSKAFVGHLKALSSLAFS